MALNWKSKESYNSIDCPLFTARLYLKRDVAMIFFLLFSRFYFVARSIISLAQFDNANYDWVWASGAKKNKIKSTL